MINRFNAYYYLLFMLLVFGAFASMAQNHYGIQILGFVALAFAAIFFIQGVLAAWAPKPDKLTLLELASLVMLSTILFMRVFYLRFPFVEILFAVAGSLLMLSYLVKMSNAWRTLRFTSRSMAILILLFLGSILAYTASLTLVPFASALAEPAGMLGLGLLLTFVVLSFWKGELLLKGERVAPFRFVLRFQDRSIVLATLFLLFTVYMGLTRVSVIPKMYLDQYPQAYYELVNRSETGSEKPIDGKFRHERFKDAYDQFVERHVTNANGTGNAN